MRTVELDDQGIKSRNRITSQKICMCINFFTSILVHAVFHTLMKSQKPME